MQRMALSSISSVSQSQTRFHFSSSSSSAKRHAKSSSNNIARRNVLVVRGAASSDENDENNPVELAAGIGGLVSCCVVGVSLFTLKNTGCGLPAGPGGLIGGIEGISYLGVAGLLGASAYKKSTTGSGLPAGPFALLGAAEGVAFLLLVAGVYVGVCQVLDYGYIPNAVPVEGGKCT